MKCPECSCELGRARGPRGVLWACPRCLGEAVTMPVLRRVAEERSAAQVWRSVQAAGRVGRRRCPSCRRPMRQGDANADGVRFTVDACTACQLVWFDRGERAALPTPTAPVAAPAVASAAGTTARQEAAIAEVTASMALFRRREAERAPGLRDLRFLPALLGMPLELHGADLRTRPWLTWITAAVVVVVSLIAFGDDAVANALAFVPAHALSSGGVTMLSSFLVHGSLMHLAGNLWFLVVFGDNVEDHLGRRGWLLLVVLATLVGNLFHALADPRATIPCVGASGGISGLMAFYALRFPRARIGTYLWFRLPFWVTFPAWGGFLTWLLLQGVLVYEQIAGFGEVSALAHLGGVLTGVAFWVVTYRRV
ncbi:MAG: rhomboid family intramembrane serine protease [Planctomycetota bacterium]